MDREKDRGKGRREKVKRGSENRRVGKGTDP